MDTVANHADGFPSDASGLNVSSGANGLRIAANAVLPLSSAWDLEATTERNSSLLIESPA